MSVDDATLERYADLAVGFGANLQRGQVLGVGGDIGQQQLVRAIAAAAYRRGARYVDPYYFDMHVKRARLLHSDEEWLDFVPPWLRQRVLGLGELRAARIGLSGATHPGVLDGIDPGRAGRDQLPFIEETAKVVNDRTTNWCAIPGPTRGWAGLVFPGLDEDAAYAKLWEQILHVMRLDEDDPIGAWRERAAVLAGAGERLTDRGFDALHFEGEGTDLRVGLLPSSRWMSARFETVDGIVHMPNLPSEEVFTTPDPGRVDGTVRATKPLELGGSVISGLRVRFDSGRAVGFDSDAGGEILAAYAGRDEGAAFLGEVALVDGDGRIGRLDTVFYDTLLDENAASHIALGSAYLFTLADDADRERANRSGIHVDFMIGGDDVDVTGLTSEGERVPVLRGGDWQI